MDLYGKDKGNVSLSPRLQTDFNEDKLNVILVNTQRAFYDLKIEETNRRIQRLEKLNRELEDILRDTDDSIKILREEEKREVSNLKSQVNSQVVRVEEYRKRLAALEENRLSEKSAHITKIKDTNDKYDKTRLVLTSQIKLLNVKTNVLEDYKSKSSILEEKLHVQNQILIRDREQMLENIRRIEWKATIDKKKLKEDLYNRLLDVANVFQLEMVRHMPCSISRLLSENIALNNMLSMIAEDMVSKKQNVEYKATARKYKREISNKQSDTKRFALIAKLEKVMVAILREICNKADANLFKLDNFGYLTAEQYMMNIDDMKIKARRCEEHVKYLEILLFCEKKKLAAAKYRKQRISERLQTYSHMLYDINYVLTNLKTAQHCKNYG